MKTPKGFNKMTLREQNDYLTKELERVHEQEDWIKRMLAKVRGGQKVLITQDERPDELLMKGEN